MLSICVDMHCLVRSSASLYAAVFWLSAHIEIITGCADDVPVLPGLDEDPEEVKKAAAKEAAAKRKAEGVREVPEDR